MRAWNRRNGRRLGALALLPLLLLSPCLAARAEGERPEDSLDVTLVIARDAVEALGLTDEGGQPLAPRKEPEMNGRGLPDEAGREPDYRGVVGYMALQPGTEITRFSTFTQTPWMLPVYEPDGDGWKQADVIQHKTPVLVTDQRLREADGGYAGFLRVIRLDTEAPAWIDAAQFVTVPYWTLGLDGAARYGCCIAVYENRSGYLPLDRKNHRGALADGTQVLMCGRAMYAGHPSGDRVHNTLLGLVFRDSGKDGAYLRIFLFFSPEDLTLVY